MNLGKIFEQIIVAKVNDSGIIILVISNDGISANISFLFYVSACLENYGIVGSILVYYYFGRVYFSFYSSNYSNFCYFDYFYFDRVGISRYFNEVFSSDRHCPDGIEPFLAT